MSKEKFSFNTETYDAIKAFIYIFIAFVMSFALIITTARYIHSVTFLVLSVILLLTTPFLFQKQYKRLFTRQVEIDFDECGFLTKEFKSRNKVIIKEQTVLWTNVKSYTCSFSQSKVLYLAINFQGGSVKRFSFKDITDQGNEEEDNTIENSIFSLFHYYINNYNQNKKLDNQIVLKPGFLTTKSGTIFLYSLTTIALLALIIQLIFAPKTLMVCIMSFSLILGLLGKRKTDKDLYNKITQLEPRMPVNQTFL